MDFANGKDDPIDEMENKIHVWNHQPDEYTPFSKPFGQKCQGTLAPDPFSSLCQGQQGFLRIFLFPCHVAILSQPRGGVSRHTVMGWVNIGKLLCCIMVSISPMLITMIYPQLLVNAD